MNNNINNGMQDMQAQGNEKDILTTVYLSDEYNNQRHSESEKSQMNIYMQLAALKQRVDELTMIIQGKGQSPQMPVNPSVQGLPQSNPLENILGLLQGGGGNA